MILLIAIAYTTATMQGKKMKQMGIQKYIGRVKEERRTERRHSSFYIGLYGQTWVNFVDQCAGVVVELMQGNRILIEFSNYCKCLENLTAQFQL